MMEKRMVILEKKNIIRQGKDRYSFLMKRFCRWQKITAILLIFSSFFSVPVQAARDIGAPGKTEIDKNELYPMCREIYDGIKVVINDRQLESENVLKQVITDKGYDYALTFLSYEKALGVLNKFDYVSFLSTYMTAREYYRQKNQTLPMGIADIPFFQMEITPGIVKERVPVKVEDFKEKEDGSFEKSGFHYIEKSESIPKFTKTNRGYQKAGFVQVIPEEIQTVYGEVTIHMITYEDLLDYMQISDAEIGERVSKRKQLIESIINNEGINQSLYKLSTSFSILSEKMNQLKNEAEFGIMKGKDFEPWEIPEWPEKFKDRLITVAVSLAGKVPYQWGGKPRMEGYDPLWWTYCQGEQQGLDCSGYIQWIYRTAGAAEKIWEKLLSTQSILEQCEVVGKGDLLPGDLGLLHNGEGINHVGMYLGDGLWVHCSSAAGTVRIEDCSFNVFRRVRVDEVAISKKKVRINESKYTEVDIYLTAQLICSEAEGEGLNGWIAVAEVVKNRCESELFPNTVREVIYQKGQFDDSDRVTDKVPSAEILEVTQRTLSGELAVLANPHVLFFKRPLQGEEKEDWDTYKYYMQINHHVFYADK